MNRPLPLPTAPLAASNLITASAMRRRLLGSALALILACLAFPPAGRAVTPAPDGGYPNSNTAEGDTALFKLSSGANNTALGFEALVNNTAGSENTASGAGALFHNTTGHDNTATGYSTLATNSTGSYNTATGAAVLSSNTAGNDNTATGFLAQQQHRVRFFSRQQSDHREQQH
jgi:hypothetical protein